MLNIKKIENRRKSKLLSQKDLSKKLGITVQSYSSAIRKKDFKVSILQEIANILEVPISYFFNESQEGEKKIIGNSNAVNIGSPNGQATATVNNCEKYKLEIKFLKQALKDKEEIIELLKRHK